MIVTDDQLKSQGVSIITHSLEEESKVFISVDGEKKFVILPANTYSDMQHEQDLAEALKDIKNGSYTTSIEEHLKLIKQ
ncbi:prevent-host-death protein [Candidatus Peregrinibacteria bacterium]|jgi:uncharacterized protein YabE (DUF348 family)|nr:prevent-host-death protein [Candidatus Peregrinibacteria bacterium]